MKKLLILALTLITLCGCTKDIDRGNVTAFVDGTIVDKYIDHVLDEEREQMHLEYYISVEVGYPIDEEYDIQVSFQAYKCYEIGDTIQFALKG